MSTDPLTEAARAIAANKNWNSADDVRDIIAAHLGARFSPDVAYMPVPRCDGCKHWREAAVDHDDFCRKVGISGQGGSFGCTQWEAK